MSKAIDSKMVTLSKSTVPKQYFAVNSDARPPCMFLVVQLLLTLGLPCGEATQQVSAPLVAHPPKRLRVRYHFALARGSGRGELWLDQSTRSFRVTGRSGPGWDADSN